MKLKHRGKFALSVVLLAFCIGATAENMARVMRGQVISKPADGLSITMLAHDGSILDITRTNSQGQYKLDLTILDRSDRKDINKLVLEIRNKSGMRQQYSVADRVKEFGTVVELEPISLNFNTP